MDIARNSEDPGIHLPVRSRNYQLEMLEAGMERNVIVAMDTGSGKTQIALLRICAEVDHLPFGKLIWFLAPSVALCRQQYMSITSQIPAIQARLLLGSDNVDRWSTQSMWDAVLTGLQVVVSTHAILSDALTHGFVGMRKLALLIFDEAHHCTGNHPANRIMRDFYHIQKLKLVPDSIPSILGLTASPIIRSKPTDIRRLEENLDSIVVTPRVHRRELLTYVHRPALEAVAFRSEAFLTKEPSHNLSLLRSICEESELHEIFSNVKVASETKSLKKKGALRRFSDKAEHIQNEIGPWAADYFVEASIVAFKTAMREGGEKLLGWRSLEKDDIMTRLSQTVMSKSCETSTRNSLFRTSAKFDHLVKILHQSRATGFSGIVFVDQRATVVALSHLLSEHPGTSGLFRCGTFVGMSSNVNKKTEIGELLDARRQQNTLDAFRGGSVNLIVTTNALEEGIDISACNTVICFDEPPNIKSFIQRRGRARKENSRFFVLVADDSKGAGVQRWGELEREMTDAYRRDREIAADARAKENVHEECFKSFLVESTGALLTMDSALAHLNHFCASLPKQPYVTLQPVFSFEENEATHVIHARVNLPSCVDPSLRQTQSVRGWRSERMATKDAAFQAYVRLHGAGLVNDHLLPCHLDSHDSSEGTPFVLVPDQHDPWIRIAKFWRSARSIYRRTISIRRPGRRTFEIALLLPLRTRSVSEFPLTHVTGAIDLVSLCDNNEGTISTEAVPLAQTATNLILRSIYFDCIPTAARDFVILLQPSIKDDLLGEWLQTCSGVHSASKINLAVNCGPKLGLLRDQGTSDGPLVICPRYFSDEDDTDKSGTYKHSDETKICAIPLTSQRNFLHKNSARQSPITLSEPTSTELTVEPRKLSKDRCTVDCLPFDFAEFALFAPSILFRVELGLIAEELCSRMLPLVKFSRIDLVIDSICATSVQLQTNHKQLEFLGSSVLKFVVARQLFVNHSNWHQGLLSKQRDLILSRRRLAEAALKAGLDEFIITKSFNGHEWRPLYISEIEAVRPKGERMLEVKILAGTVEALVGAAFFDSNLSNATRCARFFLPEIKDWSSTALFDGTYRTTRPSLFHHASYLTGLESLLGYAFCDKSLLMEAMTHPSCDWSTTCCTYERLAFLGDTVLEMTVTEFLFREAKSFPRNIMHLFKVAVTNAKFLGFLCMDLSIDAEKVVNKEHSGKDSNGDDRRRAYIHPWLFLRFNSIEIAKVRDESLERYLTLRRSIRSALSSSAKYPWQELAGLATAGFFAEIIQSIFGAIYVDSNGEMAKCNAFAEKSGVFRYLRHMIGNKTELRHPKSRLGESASGRRVTYIHSSKADGMDPTSCTLIIDDHEEAKFCGEGSREYMEIRVAELALELRSYGQASRPC